MDARPVPEDHIAARGPASGRLKRAAGWLFAALIVGVWAWLLNDQIGALRSYTWHIEPLPWLLGGLSATLYFAGLALSWGALVRSMAPGAQSDLVGAARVWLVSMVTRYLPGNIWHILSRAALAEQLRIGRATVIASASIEQLLTILGALALCALTLPSWPSLDAVAARIPAGPLLLLLVAGLLALHPRLAGAALRWASVRLRRPELAWRYTYPTILWLVAVYALVNAGSGVALFAVVAGLTPLQLADLPFIVGCSALAWVIGYLSFVTPSGLGVREGVLTTLLALSYPLPVAIIASLVFRLVSTLGELLAMLIFWGSGRASGLLHSIRAGSRGRSRRRPHDQPGDH